MMPEGDPAAPMPVPRRVAVVANAAAGALLANPQGGATLADLFAQAGLEPLFVPPAAGSLPERMAHARAMDVDAVVAAGGDGTVACAAQALVGSAMPLGILPFGTMNLLAKDLGIPVGDTEAAIAVLAAGRPRAIDVGSVAGEVFLCASMLGLPAGLARHRERGRRGRRILGWLRLAVATLRGLLRHKRLRLRLRTEAEALRISAQSVTVTVNRLTPGTGHAFGRARLDGGEFGLYVLARLRVRDLPGLAWHALTDRVSTHRTVRERQARRVVIGAGQGTVRVMNDGEVRLLRPPLRYRLLPQALLVIAPTPEADR